uniref:Origin recognition complex subunit 1 n=1 Tax=Trichogramma kaykai TaxID=54128 RepID=A0ABD2XF80_9HYME
MVRIIFIIFKIKWKNQLKLHQKKSKSSLVNTPTSSWKLSQKNDSRETKEGNDKSLRVTLRRINKQFYKIIAGFHEDQDNPGLKKIRSTSNCDENILSKMHSFPSSNYSTPTLRNTREKTKVNYNEDYMSELRMQQLEEMYRPVEDKGRKKEQCSETPSRFERKRTQKRPINEKCVENLDYTTNDENDSRRVTRSASVTSKLSQDGLFNCQTPKKNESKDTNSLYSPNKKSRLDKPPVLKERKDNDQNSRTNSEYSESSESSESFEESSDEEYEKKKKTRRNNISKTPSKKDKMQPETPSKTLAKKLSTLAITPSVQRRVSTIIKPSTPLQEARSKLHVSVLPKSLPCRETEFNDIYSFLHARLSDGSGGCIYISGVPGTGKTATVNEVIRCLKKSMTTGKLDDFNFVEINGMKLSKPQQAYVHIWKQLTGNTATWEEAHKLLYNMFTKSNSKRCMTLLLVDELDLLCTKRQDVVYNLLDWPSKTNAKLVVVTIANTMDLPERILMGKVTSRLGLTRLTFPPYNFKQLEEIVISRLKGHNDAFSGDTVQLVARKVAAVSGDARRALDICRRATEVAESNNRENVNMSDVKRALEEMIASPKIQAIKHCSDYEKLFLQAVCAEVNRTGVEEVVFNNVYDQFRTLCTFNGEIVPNTSEALSICSRLGSWRLLLCDHSKLDIHQRLLLNVSTDDVQFATSNAVA